MRIYWWEISTLHPDPEAPARALRHHPNAGRTPARSPGQRESSHRKPGRGRGEGRPEARSPAASSGRWQLEPGFRPKTEAVSHCTRQVLIEDLLCAGLGSSAEHLRHALGVSQDSHVLS